tara:strand:- start:1950 stop:2627 length:678 start_codon:yes stop_codon:yes gene_type:complete
MKNSILNKPAFRYIFEIIVIVFSVTLSFYIQNVLNEKEKIELKNLGLKGVLSDLKKDKELFLLSVDQIKERSLIIDSIIDPKFKISNEMINNGVKRYWGFIGQDRNYNSMLSTGSIEYIGNYVLQEKIHDYYITEYNLLKDFAQQDEKHFNEIEKYMNSKFKVDYVEDFMFVYNELTIKKIVLDEILRNMYMQKQLSNDGYLFFLNRTLDLNTELKKLIELELAN